MSATDHAPMAQSSSSHTPFEHENDCLLDPVVVSSSRFEDIGPYSSIIYHAEPEKWSSVLPWEFPQAASREVEEAFLRLWFEEREVHIQGGAHGPGNGFRFLKQVWYTIAIWNADIRVPSIAQWWWNKDANREIVEDKLMLDHICDPKAKPETFFNAEELKTFGYKILALSIFHIQALARQHKIKEAAQPQPNVLHVTKDPAAMLVNTADQTSLQEPGQGITLQMSEESNLNRKVSHSNNRRLSMQPKRTASANRSSADCVVTSPQLLQDNASIHHSPDPMSRATSATVRPKSAGQQPVSVSFESNGLRIRNADCLQSPFSYDTMTWQQQALPQYRSSAPHGTMYTTPYNAQRNMAHVSQAQLLEMQHLQAQQASYQGTTHQAENVRTRGNGSIRGKPRGRGKGLRQMPSNTSVNGRNDDVYPSNKAPCDFSSGHSGMSLPSGALPFCPQGNLLHSHAHHDLMELQPLTRHYTMGLLRAQSGRHGQPTHLVGAATELHNTQLADLNNFDLPQIPPPFNPVGVGKNFIAPERIDVTQLVMFGTPRDITTKEVEKLFESIQIYRVEARITSRPDKSSFVVHLSFRSHNDARRGLALDATCYRDHLIRVEVSRKYWDASWGRPMQPLMRKKVSPPDVHSQPPFQASERRDGSWFTVLPQEHLPIPEHAPFARDWATAPQRVMSQPMSRTGQLPPPQDARFQEGLVDYETVIDSTVARSVSENTPAPKHKKKYKSKLKGERTRGLSTRISSSDGDKTDNLVGRASNSDLCASEIAKLVLTADDAHASSLDQSATTRHSKEKPRRRDPTLRRKTSMPACEDSSNLSQSIENLGRPIIPSRPDSHFSDHAEDSGRTRTSSRPDSQLSNPYDGHAPSSSQAANVVRRSKLADITQDIAHPVEEVLGEAGTEALVSDKPVTMKPQKVISEQSELTHAPPEATEPDETVAEQPELVNDQDKVNITVVHSTPDQTVPGAASSDHEPVLANNTEKPTVKEDEASLLAADIDQGTSISSVPSTTIIEQFVQTISSATPRTEKPKGPSQTESFSMFGRKVERNKKKDNKAKATKSKSKEISRSDRNVSAPLISPAKHEADSKIEAVKSTSKSKGKKRSHTVTSDRDDAIRCMYSTQSSMAASDESAPSTTTPAGSPKSSGKRTGGSFSTFLGLFEADADSSKIPDHETPQPGLQSDKSFDMIASTSPDDTSLEHTVIATPESDHLSDAAVQEEDDPNHNSTPQTLEQPMYFSCNGLADRGPSGTTVSLGMIDASRATSPTSTAQQDDDRDDSSRTLSDWGDDSDTHVPSSPVQRLAQKLPIGKKSHLVEAPLPRNARRRRAYNHSLQRAEGSAGDDSATIVAEGWLAELIIRTRDSQGNKVESHFPNHIAMLLAQGSQEQGNGGDSGSGGLLIVLDASSQQNRAASTSATDMVQQLQEHPTELPSTVENSSRVEELSDSENGNDSKNT